MQQSRSACKNGAALVHQRIALVHKPLNAAPLNKTCLRCPVCRRCSACFCQRHEAARSQRCGQLKVAFRQLEISCQDYFSAFKREPQQGFCLCRRQIKQRKSQARTGQGRMAGASQCLHIWVERGMRVRIRPRHTPRQRRLWKKCRAGWQSIKAGCRRGMRHCASSRICSMQSRASACVTVSGMRRSRFCACPSAMNLRRLEAKCRSKNHVPSSRRKSLTQRRST